jgi:hypothetical protein
MKSGFEREIRPGPTLAGKVQGSKFKVQSCKSMLDFMVLPSNMVGILSLEMRSNPVKASQTCLGGVQGSKFKVQSQKHLSALNGIKANQTKSNQIKPDQT